MWFPKRRQCRQKKWQGIFEEVTLYKYLLVVSILYTGYRFLVCGKLSICLQKCLQGFCKWLIFIRKFVYAVSTRTAKHTYAVCVPLDNCQTCIMISVDRHIYTCPPTAALCTL